MICKPYAQPHLHYSPIFPVARHPFLRYSMHPLLSRFTKGKHFFLIEERGDGEYSFFFYLFLFLPNILILFSFISLHSIEKKGKDVLSSQHSPSLPLSSPSSPSFLSSSPSYSNFLFSPSTSLLPRPLAFRKACKEQGVL